MDEHGLTDWEFGWDRAVRRAGAARHRLKQITLSAKLMKQFPASQARDTILHEIAHALVGPGHGHGPVWKAKAASIGARPQRCYDSSIAKVPGNWVGTCPAGHTVDRHRVPKHVLSSCGRCAPGRFTDKHLLRWTWRGIPVHLPGTRVLLLGQERGAPPPEGIVVFVNRTGYTLMLDDGRKVEAPFILVTARDA